MQGLKGSKLGGKVFLALTGLNLLPEMCGRDMRLGSRGLGFRIQEFRV